MPEPKFKLFDRVRLGRNNIGTIVQVPDSANLSSYSVTFDESLYAPVRQIAIGVREEMLESVEGGFLMFQWRDAKREFYAGVEDRNTALILAREGIRRGERFEVEDTNREIIWSESQRTKKEVAA